MLPSPQGASAVGFEPVAMVLVVELNAAGARPYCVAAAVTAWHVWRSLWAFALTLPAVERWPPAPFLATAVLMAALTVGLGPCGNVDSRHEQTGMCCGRAGGVLR